MTGVIRTTTLALAATLLASTLQGCIWLSEVPRLTWSDLAKALELATAYEVVDSNSSSQVLAYFRQHSDGVYNVAWISADGDNTSYDLYNMYFIATKHENRYIVVTDSGESTELVPVQVAELHQDGEVWFFDPSVSLGDGFKDLAETYGILLGEGSAAPSVPSARSLRMLYNDPAFAQYLTLEASSVLRPAPAANDLAELSVKWVFRPIQPISGEGRKVALVVGNDRYVAHPPLRKAVADAESFATALADLGFETIVGRNLTRLGMDEHIARFLSAVGPGDTAVFVYAGHGWSNGQENYLLPVDAPADLTPELASRISVPVQNDQNGVVDELQRKGVQIKIVIIDACRDNPLAASDGTRGVGLPKGLVPEEPPQGTFLIYSASRGQTALDQLGEGDPNPNGVFARVFVPLMRRNQSLLTTIKQAQEEVYSLALTVNHTQEPAYYDQLRGSPCWTEDCTESAPAQSNWAVARHEYEWGMACELSGPFTGLGDGNRISFIEFGSEIRLDVLFDELYFQQRGVVEPNPLVPSAHSITWMVDRNPPVVLAGAGVDYAETGAFTTATDGHLGGADPFDPVLLSEFANGHELTIEVEGIGVAKAPLAGSAAATAEFLACIKQTPTDPP